MEKLPKTYENAGDVMTQEWQNDNVAIYVNQSKSYFEVFEIRIQKASKKNIDGVMRNFAHKEKIPANSEFGNIAYAPVTRKRAYEIKEMLI